MVAFTKEKKVMVPATNKVLKYLLLLPLLIVLIVVFLVVLAVVISLFLTPEQLHVADISMPFMDGQTFREVGLEQTKLVNIVKMVMSGKRGDDGINDDNFPDGLNDHNNFDEEQNGQNDPDTSEEGSDKPIRVTLYANGGMIPWNGSSEDMVDISVMYGEEYAFPTPVQPGYKFVGWFIDEQEKIDNTGIWSRNEIDSFFIVAQWEIAG